MHARFILAHEDEQMFEQTAPHGPVREFRLELQFDVRLLSLGVTLRGGDSKGRV